MFFEQYFAKVYFHSSLSLHSIECEGGVIDSDFRGNMNVISHNLSNKQVEFETGDRQVVFRKCKSPQLTEVSNFDDVITERNNQGFGSTEVREKDNGKFYK